MIYCDYNATAPLRPEAKDAMIEAMDVGANASSVHAPGRVARKIIEKARESLGYAIGSRADDIVFSSGGTESVSLAIHGLVATLDHPAVFVSAIEHDAAYDSAHSLECSVMDIPVIAAGVIDLEALAAQLQNAASSGQTPVVIVMLANNETGVIQPIAEVSAMVRDFGGYVICDAVQAFGKIKIDLGLLGVDYLALSGHKVGGPSGIGALWVRPGAPLKTQLLGGGQEKSRRSGTENLIGIAGFAAAAEVASDLQDSERLAKGRDELENWLKASAPVTVFGDRVSRLPNTLCLGLEGFASETQVMAMDLAGFSASSGSACSSGKVKTSRVLKAMGAPETLTSSALRLSFGWATKETDFQAVGEAWLEAAKRAVPCEFATAV